MSRVLFLACVLLLAGCGGIQSALDPAGPGAARIDHVWWLMLVVSTAVYALVMLILLWAIARRRRRGLDPGSAAVPPEPQRERRMGQVVGVGIALVQALTQIQEITLPFVPKIVAIMLVVAFTGPFIGAQISAFTNVIFERIETGF